MNAASRQMIVLCVVLLALGVVAYLMIREVGMPGRAQEQKLLLGSISDACESSIDSEGYGTFKVDRDTVIADEQGEIGVPCHVKLDFVGTTFRPQ